MSEAYSGIIEENKEMLLDILENVDSKTEAELKGEIVDCLSHYKDFTTPTIVATIKDDDPAVYYDFVDLNRPTKKLNLVPNPILDYEIARSEEDKKKGFKDDLPVSFLTIQEGEVGKGVMWYLTKFPKLPEPMAELLARYNWGDLKYQTKKKIKNDKKKAIKKGGKYEPLTFKIRKGSFSIVFD